MDLAEVNALDATIKQNVIEKIMALEDFFTADIVFYYGQIYNNVIPLYKKLIHEIYFKSDKKYSRLVIFLNTPGGSVETVEKFADINRNFYKEVYFIVPEQAMSAGTVFCLSGDKIFMDYASSLGPIDPQIFNGKQYVPALGYLDKIQEFVEKSNSGIPLNSVELFFLQQQDIAFLRLCEQQKSLTVNLIEKWLVEYGFKNNEENLTLEEQTQQAKDIAEKLGDNSQWLSHGRYINIKRLKEMGLNIEDYSNDENLSKFIREYNDLLTSYIIRGNMTFFLNSKIYF